MEEGVVPLALDAFFGTLVVGIRQDMLLAANTGCIILCG